jgi:hypothetical protein
MEVDDDIGQIKEIKMPAPVTQIACGDHHTLLLTSIVCGCYNRFRGVVWNWSE